MKLSIILMIFLNYVPAFGAEKECIDFLKQTSANELIDYEVDGTIIQSGVAHNLKKGQVKVLSKGAVVIVGPGNSCETKGEDEYYKNLAKIIDSLSHDGRVNNPLHRNLRNNIFTECGNINNRYIRAALDKLYGGGSGWRRELPQPVTQ